MREKREREEKTMGKRDEKFFPLKISISFSSVNFEIELRSRKKKGKKRKKKRKKIERKKEVPFFGNKNEMSEK